MSCHPDHNCQALETQLIPNAPLRVFNVPSLVPVELQQKRPINKVKGGSFAGPPYAGWIDLHIRLV